MSGLTPDFMARLQRSGVAAEDRVRGTMPPRRDLHSLARNITVLQREMENDVDRVSADFAKFAEETLGVGWKDDESVQSIREQLRSIRYKAGGS